MTTFDPDAVAVQEAHAIPDLPQAWDVDEAGLLVKGWGHTAETLRAAVSDWAYTDANPVDVYSRSEIWVRKFNQPDGADYAWIMQVTEPHARGAGRFTFIDTNDPIAYPLK